MTESGRYILTFACADRVGIVADVAGFLAGRDGFIVDSQQYADLATGRFFMRVAFAAAGSRFPDSLAALRAAFTGVASRHAMEWSLVDAAARPKTLIAVSKSDHCVHDLLHRWRTGTLPIDVIGVVSNHASARPLAAWHGVPFVHLPGQGREAAFAHAAADAEIVVLARYMQVLSPALTATLTGRCINIHHSFLPSFPGARPYARAHARGVKLIGATAHYVTEALDEGPIIEQDVTRVDHRATEAEMVAMGRDVEAAVLARAVGWVATRRVLPNGDKTVVFR